jgi:hypothetical protein
MLVERHGDGLAETGFAALPDHLRAGDLLVLNETRVVPARLRAVKPTGGQVDLLLLDWAGGAPDGARGVMLSTSKGIHPGVRLRIADDLEAEVLDEPREGRGVVRFITPRPAESGWAASGSAVSGRRPSGFGRLGIARGRKRRTWCDRRSRGSAAPPRHDAASAVRAA